MENSNPMNQVFEAQKKMIDSWQSMFDQGTEVFNIAGGNTINPFQFYNNLIKTMPTVLPSDPRAMFKQIGDNYYNIYKLYQDLYENNIEPTQENFEQMIKDWTNKSNEMFQQILLPYLPTEMQELIQQTMDTSEAVEMSFKEFWGPWLESTDDVVNAIMEGVFHDPDAFIEILEEWKENYSDTFSKLLNMPAFGIGRNVIETEYKNLDNYVQLLTYVAEVMVSIIRIGHENIIKVIEDAFNTLKDGENIPTFEEFYNYWKDSFGQALESMFYTEEFSKLLGKFVEALTEYKITSDKVLERQLEFLPVPTKTDMRSVYKSIYELKREVRSLRKQVADLEAANKND